MQKQQTKQTTAPAKSTTKLKEQFEVAKQKEVRPLTRTIIVKHKFCCGCGCDYLKFEREVPYDSPLRDGSIVTEVLATDKRKL
jgi:hypothetical protein